MDRAPKICFLDETTELNTLDDLKYRGRGGIVNSLRILPDVLSQLGFKCFVISDIRQGGVTEEGTTWYQKGAMSFAEKNQQYDFLVYNRQTCNGFSEIKTRRRILWTHDIPHNGFIPDPRIMTAFDATVFMSRYAERIWHKYFPTIGKSFLIPNGVARPMFCPREKDLNYIIFISAPNRGLKRLPMIFQALKNKSGKPLYLKAFSDMRSLHPQDCDDYSGDYKACTDAGIELLKPVRARRIADELGKASLMILPSDYPEICSNSILQALASGVPVLTSNIGSAKEWIKHGKNGYLTEFLPHDYFVFDLELVRFALHLLTNTSKHQKMIKSAAGTKIHSWFEIGKKWKKMLSRL